MDTILNPAELAHNVEPLRAIEDFDAEACRQFLGELQNLIREGDRADDVLEAIYDAVERRYTRLTGEPTMLS